YPAHVGDRLRAAAAGGERLTAGARRWLARRPVSELRALLRFRAAPRQASRAVRAPSFKPAILYPPALPWAYRFQRPQQLARALAACEHPLLYVDAFRRTRVLPRRRLVATEAGVDLLQLAVPGRPDPFRDVLDESTAHELALTIAEGVVG